MSLFLNTEDMAELVMGPDVEACAANAIHPEKSGPGIYMLFGKDDDLQYIGKSMDLSSRIDQHWYAGRYGRAPRFASYACMRLPRYAVRDVEVAHIYALEPPRNALYEGIRWEQHDAMVKHIQEIWGPKR